MVLTTRNTGGAGQQRLPYLQQHRHLREGKAKEGNGRVALVAVPCLTAIPGKRGQGNESQHEKEADDRHPPFFSCALLVAAVT